MSGTAGAPIIFAFAVATLSAFSHLELGTKYPGASGAALYTHQAFGKQFCTFMVTFAALASGLTSASTTSMAVANNLNLGFSIGLNPFGVVILAITFLVLLAAVNCRGAPGIPIDKIYPFITIFAVANTALLNMMMASRLVYGMAKQGVLPRFLAKVHAGRRTPYAAILFTTALGVALLALVGLGLGLGLGEDTTQALGSTTALLLLGVFTFVNIAAILLRKDTEAQAREHFNAPPRGVPYVGAASTLYLLGIGVVLSVLNWLFMKNVQHDPDARLTMGDTRSISIIGSDPDDD